MSAQELEKGSWLHRSRRAIIQAFQRFLPWILRLPIGWRILLSALLGSLGGSTFLGFFNLFAAYNYAFWYGARVPVEGLPYLSLTVSLLSLAALLVVFFSTALLSTVLWLVGRVFHKPSKYKVLIRSLISVMLLAFFAIVTWQRLQHVDPADAPWTLSLILVAVALVILALWRPGLSWVAGSSLAVWLFLIVLGLMFLPGIYAQLLRELRFGGGIRAAIADDVETLDREPQYFLFLITADNYLLYEPEQNRFLETPRTDQIMLRYTSGKADYRLPSLRCPFRSTLTPGLVLRLLSIVSFATLITTGFLAVRASRWNFIESSAPEQQDE